MILVGVVARWESWTDGELDIFIDEQLEAL